MCKIHGNIPKSELMLIREQVDNRRGKKLVDDSFLELPTGQKEYLAAMPQNN